MSADYSLDRDMRSQSRSRSRSFSPGRSPARDAYSPMSPRDEQYFEDRGADDRAYRGRSYSRSRSYSRERRRVSRSPSRSPSHSYSPRYSRSPRRRRVSRSPSRSYSPRYSRSPRRSFSRSPARGSPGREEPRGTRQPILIVYRLTENVRKKHLFEIFEEYGKVARVAIMRHWSGIRNKGETRAVFMAIITFAAMESAQKALDYMDGAMIDNERVVAKLDELGSRNNKRRGGGARRRKSPRRRAFNRSPPRRRRFERGWRSPVRSRSPPRRMSRSRRYSRSPSPRYGGYRGRYGRSRSFSRRRR
ncbi:hypothetical protein GGI25_001901 [Coemansia spiralis]|uniref:RRM domain-containing protein n=2 Tax=Coemansia TaxID=4863 RepID=A0A9W8G9N5_9FUNG|nr:hypothetical protein EDC05_002198 [Coemansia umbellata]KAJ2623517.1 hypothetical protein GGI26_002356 [Coemansia sp. RSA 1358]KAJ2678912.1 hypothetical protein GGI25_001901 [Coemansia spiralis]